MLLIWCVTGLSVLDLPLAPFDPVFTTKDLTTIADDSSRRPSPFCSIQRGKAARAGKGGGKGGKLQRSDEGEEPYEAEESQEPEGEQEDASGMAIAY